MKTIHLTFNAVQYMVPVFNTSDELEDVLDILTSNTSMSFSLGLPPTHLITQAGTSPKFWIRDIPIHPAWNPMDWDVFDVNTSNPS